MRKVTTGALSSDKGEEHGSGFQTMRRVAPYLWPEGETWVKRRVVAALVFLLLAKLVAITMGLRDSMPMTCQGRNWRSHG